MVQKVTWGRVQKGVIRKHRTRHLQKVCPVQEEKEVPFSFHRCTPLLQLTGLLWKVSHPSLDPCNFDQKRPPFSHFLLVPSGHRPSFSVRFHQHLDQLLGNDSSLGLVKQGPMNLCQGEKCESVKLKTKKKYHLCCPQGKGQCAHLLELSLNQLHST